MFQNKYVGKQYVEACHLEFIELKQRDRSVVEYEAEFLRLSRCAQGMVVTEQDKSVSFQNKLRYELMIQVASL